MHDINFIRNNPIEFDNSIQKRGEKPCSETILKIDEEKRKAQTHLQQLLAERNILSKEIGILKSKQKKDDEINNKVEKLKDQISVLKELEKIKDDELQAIISRIPNIASEDVPSGLNEKDNISIITYSCKAKELFMDMPCTTENKKIVQQDLDDLKPGGTTNMWGGLKTSLDCLKLNSPPNKMKVIKLLTDGVPSHIPNRGQERIPHHLDRCCARVYLTFLFVVPVNGKFEYFHGILTSKQKYFNIETPPIQLLHSK